MDEIYVTYVDDEHVDNHDFDDTTDDDHDNNNGLAWSGPVRPGSSPGRVRVRRGSVPVRSGPAVATTVFPIIITIIILYGGSNFVSLKQIS